MNAVTKNYIDEIDSMIKKRSLLLHPFYRAWTKGELTMESLRDYASQYYHHVAAFPTYLSATHANMVNIQDRRLVLENLNDEEAGTPNHPELWLQFVESLGLSRNDAIGTPAQSETRNLIGEFRNICGQKSTASALAALYAYESQIPAIAESKINGLKRHYGFEDNSGIEYFTVHIEADKEHSAVERNLLSRYIDSDNAAEAMESIERVLTALWGLLDGVSRRHGIECAMN
jgi:pyrroloquinoline-quinone synthase